MRILKILVVIGLFLLPLRCSDKNVDVEGLPQPDLRDWLDAHPDIKSAIKIEQESATSFYFGGALTELSYDQWSEEDKALLDAAFARSWYWIYQSGSASEVGAAEFSMPLSCTYCEARLLTHPTSGAFTVIPEALSKTVYMSYVAQSLALEAGEALNWSVATASAANLHHLLNSRSMMHRMSGSTDFFFGEPGGGGDARIKYIGRVSPATPIFVYNWARAQGILKETEQATVVALLEWLRANAVHFYGTATYANMQEHWGYPAQTSAYHVMVGTVRDTENTVEHWTAGCHGTVGFVKSLLKALNIPVETIYTCGHGQLYFPTLGLYLDHGDNPYNANVTSQPAKEASSLLVDQSTYTTWFSASPDYLDPANPLCNNIGRSAQDF